MAKPSHPPRREGTPDASGYVIAAAGNGEQSRNQDDTPHSNFLSSASSSYGSKMRRPLPRASHGGSHSSPEGTDSVPGPVNYDEEREYGRFLAEGHYLQPHNSVGFWDHKMSKVRAHVLLLWARTILIVSLFILAVLSLYWAVQFQVEDKMSVLTVHVVDFDGQVAPYNDNGVTPIVGPIVTDTVQQLLKSAGTPTVGWEVIPPDQYNFDPMAVRQGVYDWTCWAAIIVSANATTLLQDAVLNGNASYDPTGAVQMIIQSARQDTTFYNYIIPQFDRFRQQFGASFGRTWGQAILSNTSYVNTVLATVPQAINPGASPLQIDLRPFGPPQATPAVTIGLIYLIIVAFFSFSFFLPIHQKFIQPQGHPPLHFWQLIAWRWVATIICYVFISLIYSLVPLAFQVPFSRPPASTTDVAFNATAYGRGSFVVYWAMNFVGMGALGLACENVAMIIGMPWTALWLIFWVITNVSTSFYAIPLAPSFFQWGYAWPLHHIVQASRQILFDLHSEIGKNVAVLVAWAVVNTLLFPFCCYFMRWKTERDQRANEREKDRYVVHTTDGEKEFPKVAGENPPKRKRGFMRGV